MIAFAAMTPAHLDAVLAIESGAHMLPWTRGNFLDSLSAGHTALLLQEDASVLGYAIVMPLPDEAELLNITITPTRQGQGFGQALLRHVCATAAAQGAQRLFLEVRASNAAARTLYARSGFAEVGLRKGYYATLDSLREDAILMAKDLDFAAQTQRTQEAKQL